MNQIKTGLNGLPEKLWRSLSWFLFIFATLFICHLIFTFMMHGFNSRLAAMAGCALDSGFLILPGPATYPYPSSWQTAFCSAIFFTLTTGAMSYVSGDILAFFLSSRFRNGRKSFYGLGISLLIITLTLALSGMPLVFPLSFCVTAFISGCLRLSRFNASAFSRRRALITAIIAAFFLVVLSFQGPGFFSGIRDRLLFGTKAGEAVIDFYYRYNLYAAEVIKKPEARMVKTIKAGTIQSASDFESIRHGFEKKGFAFLRGKECSAFYDVSLKDGMIEVIQGDKPVISFPFERFRSDSSSFFREFFSKEDDAEVLRLIVSASFCLGIPLILLGLLTGFYSLEGKVAESLALSDNGRKIVSKKMIALVLILIFFAFTIRYFFNVPEFDSGKLDSMLSSEDGNERVEAMAHIIRKKLDPDRFRLPAISPGQGKPRERILFLYLASRSGGIRRFETISPFIEDPYPYVACQAIRFLSQLGDERAEAIFEDVLRTHPNLYVQFTAREALKTWKKRTAR